MSVTIKIREIRPLTVACQEDDEQAYKFGLNSGRSQNTDTVLIPTKLRKRNTGPISVRYIR